MTIRLIDRAGLVLGIMTLPATIKLIDLEPLKKLGAARVEIAK